jgi:hypothetical protein
MAYLLMAFSILFGAAIPAAPAMAGAGAGVAVSAVSIGIHISAYPELVPIPGYPVYYAPQLRANYFFHNGFYWIYHDDRWYVSAWYNGPWDFVDPHDVPLVVLQVPVRYYPAPPVYFHAWVVDAPPRWDLHWGHRWVRQRHDWNHSRVVRGHAPPIHRRQHVGPANPRVQYRREPDRRPPRNASVQGHERRSGFRSAPRDLTRLPQAVTPLPQAVTPVPQVQTPFRGSGQPRSAQRTAPAPRMQVRERPQVNGNGRQFRGNTERQRTGTRSGFEARVRGRN